MAATIKDIARETGLGLATISKYLNGGNVLPENKVAIKKAVKKLHYSVNEFGRGLKTQRSMAIGVVVPEFQNTFFMQVVTEMESVLKKEDYAIILSDCRLNRGKEIEAVNFLLSKKVDGIISFPTSSSGRHLTQAIDQGVPALTIDRLVPALRGRVDSITIDNREISTEAVRLMTRSGHRKIGVITGPKNTSTADARLQGYLDALAELGIEADPRFIVRCDYSMEGARVAFQQLLAQNPDMTGVFATNNYVSMGVLEAVNLLSLKIPKDISIVAFDKMEWSRIFSPSLCIVEQPMKEMGRVAAEIMLRRLKDGYGEEGTRQAVILGARLIKGRSVRQLKAEGSG